MRCLLSIFEVSFSSTSPSSYNNNNNNNGNPSGRTGDTKLADTLSRVINREGIVFDPSTYC